MLGDIGIVLLFIVIGGCFNAAEISMISMRESQVRHLAETRGARGRRLERLVSDPNRFLAAVQIGVTVMTMLSSAFGAATISDRLAESLQRSGMSEGTASTLSLVGTTLVISFFSLVLGELTPKRLGMQHRESIALFASGPLSVLARFFRPAVWLLGKSTNVMVRLLGGDPAATGDEITSEELQSLVAAHDSLTVVERRVIADVFDAEDKHVREVMVPRPEVQFLPAAMTASRAAKLALAHPHSRFPVIGRDADEVIGVVHLRSLFAPDHPKGRAATLADLSTPITVVPGTKGVLDALHEMRAAGQHLAVVVDEYGGTAGIVTLEDLVEEIVGEMVSVTPDSSGHPPVRAGEVDGMTNLDDFTEITGLELPPGPYNTVAGFVLARLGRLAVVGDTVTAAGRVLTVASTDARRISRIIVGPAVSEPAPGDAGSGGAEDPSPDTGSRGGHGPAGSSPVGVTPAPVAPEAAGPNDASNAAGPDDAAPVPAGTGGATPAALTAEPPSAPGAASGPDAGARADGLAETLEQVATVEAMAISRR